MVNKVEWQGVVGIFSVLFAVAAMADMPLTLRVVFFTACIVCLLLLFFSHKEWGSWRWIGSVGVVLLFAFIIFHIVTAPEPRAAKPVTLTWQTPTPISSSTALTAVQLNAKASSDGSPVSGEYVYYPAPGSTLPPGGQTLQVKFTPSDLTTYMPKERTVTILVNNAEKFGASPNFKISNAGFAAGDYVSGQSRGLQIYQQVAISNVGSAPGSLSSATLTLKLKGKTYNSVPILTPNSESRQPVARNSSNDATIVLPGRSYWVHAVAESPLQVNATLPMWVAGQFPGLTYQEVQTGHGVLSLKCVDARGKVYGFSTTINANTMQHSLQGDLR